MGSAITRVVFLMIMHEHMIMGFIFKTGGLAFIGMYAFIRINTVKNKLNKRHLNVFCNIKIYHILEHDIMHNNLKITSPTHRNDCFISTSVISHLHIRFLLVLFNLIFYC